MHRKTLMQYAVAASAFTLALAVSPGTASATPSPETSQPKHVERTYLIHDPGLIANPQKILDAITPEGTLNIETVTPAKPKAAATQSYVVDSSRFLNGSKPADPYQYMAPAECKSRLTQAAKPEGWIKNAYSYCQSWAFVRIAADCGIGGCKREGVLAATPFIYGYGKIGAYKSGTYARWADFWLRMNVVTATGPYRAATISATMGCRGYVNHQRDDTKCHLGDKTGRTALMPEWQANDAAQMHLVSDAATPNAADAQIAYAVFQPQLEVKLPGGFTEVGSGDPDGQEGGMRFDSAYYLAPNSPAEQLGSVFDRAAPGFQYRLNDPDVQGVAQHIDSARKNPDSTKPTGATGKHLSGASPSDPIHRLVPGRSATQKKRYDQNRNTVRAFCRSAAMQPKPAGTECDEYPFASTYEGAARWRYDGAQYRYWYSAKWVDAGENNQAGQRLGAWYLNDRILDDVDDEATARNGYFLVVK